MLGSWIRRTAFKTLDFVKGRKVQKHYKDILQKMELGKSIEPSLDDLLTYVQKHVPYYKNRGYKSLKDFPIISKNDIMNSYEQFRSDEYTDDASLHEVVTIGSSGNPFHAFQNADKRNRVVAELMYIHNRLGWKIGDRYVFMRAWTGNYNKLGFQQFKQNFVPVEVTAFGEKQMDDLRKVLKKDKKIEVILGYSSALSELARYMLLKGDCKEMFNIRIVLADSDTLTPAGKKNLETLFGCPVISRYSNEEQGILAYSKPYSDEYVINSANYFIEIMSMDGDYPVKSGETGRIVITDMYNKAMPFIRYDIGDLAKAGKSENGRFLSFEALQGRTADLIYTMDGNMISSASVNNYICDFYDIKKYQLIQYSEDTFELLLVCDEQSSSVKAVEENMRKLLGADVNLTIRIVADIEAKKNGKYQTTVNLWK